MRGPDDWEAGPGLERAEMIDSVRRTEVKWAKRCRAALVALLVLAVVAVSAVFTVR